MKEVDLDKNSKPATKRVGVDLGDQTSHTKHKTTDKGGEGTSSIDALPKESEQKNGRDRGRYIGLHTLQIVIELTRHPLQEWDPENPQQDEYCGSESTHPD